MLQHSFVQVQVFITWTHPCFHIHLALLQVFVFTSCNWSLSISPCSTTLLVPTSLLSNLLCSYLSSPSFNCQCFSSFLSYFSSVTFLPFLCLLILLSFFILCQCSVLLMLWHAVNIPNVQKQLENASLSIHFHFSHAAQTQNLTVALDGHPSTIPSTAM